MINKYEESLRRYRVIIGAGFGLILIAVITLSASLLLSYQETLAEFEETVYEHNLKVEYATLAEMSVHMRGELQQLMVLIDDPFYRDEVFLRFNKLGYDVNVAREKLKELAEQDVERQLISQQDDVIQLMVDKHRVINNLLLEGKKDEAAEIIVNAYDSGELQSLFTSLKEMREFQKAMSERHLKNARDNLDETTQITVTTLALIVFAALFMAWIFTRYASRESVLQNEIVKRMDESNRRYEYLAMHDNLTDLPNRAQFFGYAGEAFMRVHGTKQSLYFLFLDIDGFKPVNDSLGHEAGNDLLQQIAIRIQGLLAESDFVARLGGDEFVVITQGSKDEVAEMARQLVKTICTPYGLSAGEVKVGTSVGIADVTKVKDVDEALHLADIAMYQSKRSGGCRYTFSSDIPLDEIASGNESKYLRT